MEPRRVLIVANKTLFGKSLADAVAAIVGRGPATFLLLVPAEIPDTPFVWEESAVWKAAEARAAQGVAAFTALGAVVSARVGAHVPINAVKDALLGENFDEVVVSTLPLGISAWVGLDLPNRIRSVTGLPVTHVTSDPSEPEPVHTVPAWDRPSGRP